VRSTDTNLVRELPLCREMTDANFDSLMSAALLQKFPQHTNLIREGDLPDFLHIIIDGSVELFAAWDEREVTLDILGPISTFILAAVIRDEVYLKSARTLTATQILMLPAASVRDVFGRDAAFARAIVNELAIRYRSVVRSLKDHKLRTSAERLANWILEVDRQQGGSGRILLPHDKRTLASRLGMTPENLSRSLANLSEHGVVSSGREIVVADREALQRWAKPDPLIDGP
jgi:CRP/FNR family transcriptional activator FtrB